MGLLPQWFEEDNGFSVGKASAQEAVDTVSVSIPADFTLSQNYPNPFNSTTVISYDIPDASDVTVEVINILGQRVCTLVSEKQEAGGHTVLWDATSESRNPVATGVYFYRIHAGSFHSTKKMLLLK